MKAEIRREILERVDSIEAYLKASSGDLSVAALNRRTNIYGDLGFIRGAVQFNPYLPECDDVIRTPNVAEERNGE